MLYNLKSSWIFVLTISLYEFCLPGCVSRRFSPQVAIQGGVYRKKADSADRELPEQYQHQPRSQQSVLHQV